MSLTEKYGTRSLEYSAWHRPASMRRYIDAIRTDEMRMIDVDGIYLEYSRRDGSRPLLLVEEAMDVGQNGKFARVISQLAKFANIPAIVVLWRKSIYANPADPERADIECFRVRRAWPQEEMRWSWMQAEVFPRWLWEMREIGRLHGGLGRPRMDSFNRWPVIKETR